MAVPPVPPGPRADQVTELHTAFPREALDGSIIARFADQVERHASRTALATPREEWSYAELDARSTAIASAIIARLGLGSAPVALLMDQGAPLVAATMGVLKARKFYVPIEPWHSIERWRETLALSDARLVVTAGGDAAVALQLAELGVEVLNIDTLQQQGSPLPVVAIDALDPAYLYFTSGSTGKPKGVIDSHRNVLHNIMRYTNALAVRPNDRLTLIQSVSFSGTVSSLFTALLNGATVLPFDLRNEGFLRLAAWMKRSKATIYHSVPSIFRGVVEDGGNFRDVRVVRLEGDGATRTDVELFRSAFSDACVLAHGLGATETGLSCQYRMTRDVALDGVSVPIGFPLPDMDVRIVDDDGIPMTAGTVGEIEVRSAFLATGYWNDPELTRERFIGTTGSDERRYRTGDLGRMDADGCFHHLGRKDLEHKINGQFVDTKEVERALRRTGSFDDVLVITRRDDEAEARIVAYVVPGASSGGEVQWRRDLSGVLPMHLMPSAFVALKALPVSEHGKVDRKALPKPPRPATRSKDPPRSEDEKQLARLWEDVLKASHVGRQDNFFQLGGDSLRAALVVARIEQLTGVVLPATVLLEAPTITELARAMRSKERATEGEGVLLTLQAGGSKPPFFCLDWPTGGGWQYATLARRLGPDRPFHCILSGAIPDPWPAGVTIEQMAEAAIRLIRKVRPTGPVLLGGTVMVASSPSRWPVR